jgi:WD40 repeat protein
VSYPLACVHCGAAKLLQAEVCIQCGQPSNTNAQYVSVSRTTGFLRINSLLNQRYLIISQVGRGGMGAVYKAEDTKLGSRLVAIKEMSQSNLGPREIAIVTNAFKQEAHTLASLQHPNLPSIHDYFNQNGRFYLVMSFIEGETLEHYMETTNKGYLTIKEVLEIGIQLCTVLDFLHSRQPPIIFRDLKPSNIMRSPNGHIYLIDFGIVRHFKQGQTRDTKALGTLGYAAPEQYGKGQTSPRADIYGLGATLHYLLSGNDPINTPFRFTPLHFQDQTELLDLEMLVIQMVDMDENKRPGSIAAIKQELQRIAAQAGENKTGLYRNPSTSPMAATRAPKPVAATPRQVSTTLRRTTAAPSYQGAIIYTFRSFLPIHAIDWSPDGTLIASAGSNVQLWEATTGKTIFTYRGHSKTVNAVAWSPDHATSTPGSGYRIASCSDDRTVQVWKAATGNNITTYTGHDHFLRGGSVIAIAWSPDGTLIASAGHDKTVQVWHVATGSNMYIYQGHAHRLKGGAVNTLAWSPDGQLIASGSNDKTLQVWEATSGTYIFALRENASEVRAVAWSPDSKCIASGDNAGKVRIWDAATGNIIYTYSAHSAAVRSIDWSPDKRHIASASDDNTVQIWDALAGNRVFTYNQHTASVKAVNWSPDSARIASASDDRTVQVWQPL